ncbi:MAG: hypothetical protein OER88_09920, partial [Planctomycetota bacterium]|nr:hypothetical protein [Planctomycetota bacterium]
MRVGGGALLLVFAIRSLWRRRRSRDGAPEMPNFHLLLGAVVAMVSVASLPLLYLTLQSYVPEWPGAMCIQGVTRVGIGSGGATGHLPGLVAFLEAAKPFLIFLAGIWATLHLINRADREATRTGAVLVALAAFGLFAVIDGAAESAYLFIPKQDQNLVTTCCTTAINPYLQQAALAAAGAPALAGPVARHQSLVTGFFGVGSALIVLSFVMIRRAWAAAPLAVARWSAVVLAVISVPLGVSFLQRVLAPAALQLPHHECAYCVLADVPESAIGIGLFGLGILATGWAAVAHLVDRESLLGPTLYRVARFGFAGGPI